MRRGSSKAAITGSEVLEESGSDKWKAEIARERRDFRHAHSLWPIKKGSDEDPSSSYGLNQFSFMRLLVEVQLPSRPYYRLQGF